MKVFKQVPIEEWVKKEPKEGWYIGVDYNEKASSFYHTTDNVIGDNSYGWLIRVQEEVELSELIKEDSIGFGKYAIRMVKRCVKEKLVPIFETDSEFYDMYKNGLSLSDILKPDELNKTNE